jgi:hypothetical protein
MRNPGPGRWVVSHAEGFANGRNLQFPLQPPSRELGGRTFHRALVVKKRRACKYDSEAVLIAGADCIADVGRYWRSSPRLGFFRITKANRAVPWPK